MKIIKEFKHSKKMFEGWKTCNMLIITNEVEVKGRGIKILIIETYFPTFPKVELRGREKGLEVLVQLPHHPFRSSLKNLTTHSMAKPSHDM